MASTASLAIDSANRKTNPNQQPAATSTIAPSTVTTGLGAIVKLVPTDIVGMYVVVLTFLRTNEGFNKDPVWLWVWFFVAMALSIIFFCIQFAQSYRQANNAFPSWRSYPAWRILLTVIAFAFWAFSVQPDATYAMFADHQIASLLSTAAIIVIGPLLSAIDGLLNPN